MDPNQYPRPPQQPLPLPPPPPQQQQAAPPPFAYDPSTGGHFGAASQVAQSGYIPATAQFNQTFANVTQGLQGQYRNILATYWQHVIYEIENEDHDFKVHQLPLARIKKVMKSDEDVKMISAEAPILFARGCDIFITELTMRAWIHAEESKRRTLQRSDIAQAISKSDMFDFLIDIVPREVAQQHASMGGSVGGAPSFDYKRGGDEAGPPGTSPGGNPPGAFPLGGYQDHAQGGVNYQSGPLGYAATPPGSSAGQGGQAYPHHSGHPLYDGNRYDPMYYSGQQQLHNLSYPPHEHPPQGDQPHQQHEYNGPPGQSGYTGGDDVSHYYGSGGAR